MRAHGTPTARRQEQAIAALLQCGTITEAALGCGISEATLYRWLLLDDFQTAYRAARRQVVQQAIAQVQRAASEAVDALRQVMHDGASPASAKVSAARTILETAVKAVELEDLESRIAALETLRPERLRCIIPG